MMAGVIPYPYRPEPDFYYLTGVAQPGCVAVVVAAAADEEGIEEGEEEGGRIRQQPTTAATNKGERQKHHFILFVPDECPRSRLWDGGRLSVASAKRVFGADEAFPMSQVREREFFFFFFFFFSEKGKKKTLNLDLFSTTKNNSSTPASPRCSPRPL